MTDWKKHLRYDANNRVTNDIGNVILILKNSPGFEGTLAVDAGRNLPFWLTVPLYDCGLKPPELAATLHERHVPYVQHVLAKLFGLSVGPKMVMRALDAAAYES